MDAKLLDRLFNSFKAQKIAVIGDFALDFYFNLQTNTNEFSVETEKEVFHAHSPKSSLGGAGNVCKNLAHLGVNPYAFGIIGQDLFGREMLHQMDQLHIDYSNIFIEDTKGTPVYSKPMEGPVEFNRIDFGTTDIVDETTKAEFLFQTCLQLHNFDGIILNEQFLHPLLSSENIKSLEEEIVSSNLFAIADFRSLGKHSKNVILKINLKEFSHVIGIPVNQLSDIKIIQTQVKKLLQLRNKGILLTLGEMGIMYADQTKIVHEPALPVKGTIDTVGAGDMVVAAFASAMLAGASESEACQFANLCAHLSIHKIGETGSANWDEIMKFNK